MLSLSSPSMHFCENFRRMPHESSTVHVVNCLQCTQTIQRILIYCKTTSNLPLNQCRWIAKWIDRFHEVPESIGVFKVIKKIKAILVWRQEKPWSTISPKISVSKRPLNLLKNESLDLRLDSTRLAGVVSFLNKYSHLLDPLYEKNSAELLELKIISGFFHIDSPFHLIFPPELLELENTANPLIVNFLMQKHVGPIYKHPQFIQKEDIKNLHEIRLNLLKELFSYLPKREGNVGIIGAGPAGLLRAILCSLMGYKVFLLDKRPHHFCRETQRDNVIVLGSHGFADLNTLSILGIWDKLIESDALTVASGYAHFQGVYYLTISDLEKNSLKVLEELELSQTSFHSDVKDIYLEGASNSRIYFKNQWKRVDALVVSDGAHSTTLHNLRIEKKKYGKSAIALAAFFERKTTSTSLSCLSISEKDKFIASVSAGILLRHQQDYLGSPLNHVQLKEIKASSNNQIQEIAKQNYAKLLKIIYLEERPLEEVLPLSCSLIHLKMEQAESPLYFHKKTPILLRGDAYGTVHPASGYGAQTAITSLKADGMFFSYFNKSKSNEKLNECFSSLAEHYFQKAQHRSLFVQYTYMEKCDKPYFFLNKAKQRGLINATEMKTLTQLIMEIKFGIFKNSDEFLMTLKKKIIFKFLKRYDNKEPVFDDNSFHPSTSLLQRLEKAITILKLSFPGKSLSPGGICLEEFKGFFSTNRKTPLNHLLNKYAIALINNPLDADIEILDLATLLGTLNWIDYCLKTLSTCNLF